MYVQTVECGVLYTNNVFALKIHIGVATHAFQFKNVEEDNTLTQQYQNALAYQDFNGMESFVSNVKKVEFGTSQL